MNRSTAGILAMTAALLIAPAGAEKAPEAETMLRAAQQKETLEGDLKGAIKQYAAIAAKYARTDRGVTATALIRMAECYQKMGDTESRNIYERVIRDYADQKEAVAEARARLGAEPFTAGPARATGDRPVWTGDADGFGTISPDGRYLTYTDWKTGGLVLRELATGTDRRLTAGAYSDGQTEFSVISKDGKQVAFEWFLNDKKRYELRIASLAGSGVLEGRTLVDNADFKDVSPYDWSADGKWLAVFVQRQDRTGQIGVVSVPEGKLRVLKSVDWRGPRKIFFSPDGRYIAYDLRTGESERPRHIFVMAVDGSGESVAVAHPSFNAAMGWSPDGRWALFASDRSGSMGLWGVPMEAGKARGGATLLRADIGSSWSLGLTAAGTLYVWKSTPVYLGVAPLDLDGGKAPAMAGAPLQIFIGSRGRPDWSRNGKELAYQSCGALGGGPCTLIIRSMETGATRELEPKLQYFFFPRFSPDGKWLLAPGTDLKGRKGTFRIDAATGEATAFAIADSVKQWWDIQGGEIYYLRGNALVDRNLLTGEEREVAKGLPADFRGFSVSPDGKHIAWIDMNKKTDHSLAVLALGGGEDLRAARVLLRADAPQVLRGDQGTHPAWTPDGRAVIVAKVQSGDEPHSELWRVPVDGSAPKKLDVDAENWTADGFRISPDGRRIAFVSTAGRKRLEIWAVENFLPATTAKSR